jgi:ABC-type taurine transport system ATPase subunit
MLMKRMTIMMTRAIDEAVELLRDKHLVWSSDLEDIKLCLADLLVVSAAEGDILETLADNLAKRFISQAPAPTIYNPNLEKRDA